MLKPFAVDFPLKGLWVATKTPAHCVPSHGTDFMAQRFAFDFMAVDPDLYPYKSKNILNHLIGRTPAHSSYGWSAHVFSPIDGIVASALDGWPDKQRISLLVDGIRCLCFPPKVDSDDIRPLTGNYLVIQSSNFSCLMAHLRQGSLRVRPGFHVNRGDCIGEVGFSGNSTTPHLHFQLMDSPDPQKAKPYPCCFNEYECWTGKKWEIVRGSIPRKMEMIKRSN